MLIIPVWIRYGMLICIALMLRVSISMAHAEAAPSLEYKVKASFIYNISKYVYWSPGQFADANSALDICVLGDDPFGSSLDEVQGRQVQDRSISIKRYDYPSPEPLLASCHILYLSNSLKEQAPQIERTLRLTPVLTISDVSNQGMVTFVVYEGKVKLQINLRKTREAGLRLSAHLLQLAEITEE